MTKEKRCSTCKEIKPIEQFGKNRNTKSGYMYECKECCKAYSQSTRGKTIKRLIIVKRYQAGLIEILQFGNRKNYFSYFCALMSVSCQVKIYMHAII